MSEDIVGYYAEVTEYEAGWGSKHDGFLVSPSKQLICEQAESLEKDPSYEIFWKVGEIKLCLLTPEGAAKIEQVQGRSKWIDRGQLKNYVKET